MCFVKVSNRNGLFDAVFWLAVISCLCGSVLSWAARCLDASSRTILHIGVVRNKDISPITRRYCESSLPTSSQLSLKWALLQN